MPMAIGCTYSRLSLVGRLLAFTLPLNCLALLGGVLLAAPEAAFAAPPAATATTLAVTSGGNPVTTVASGSVVTLTATVMAGTTPVSPGLVNFCDATAAHCEDIHILGTAQLTSAGTAAFKFRPAVGSHSYKAVFVGTNTNAGSVSGTAALAVTGTLPTATMISSLSGNAGDYTLTVTVGGAGSAAPTGTVSFLDASNGNAVLGTATLGAGTAGLSFLNVSNSATGVSPFSIAVGDFNGDGIPDLAVANYGRDTVTILLGNGDGTFTAASASPATGSEPVSIAVGDFNGDGVPDLAVVNSDDTITILLGKGDGTFTAASASPATGIYPISIAVGDFNGDGIPDLVVANSGDYTITILLGNGDGTFTSASPVTGINPYSIAVGDFNGDGIPDLAVTSNDTITILLGKGDGTFTATSTIPATQGAGFIVVGDFNGDGIPDLAVVNRGSIYNTLTILLGNGDGTFTASASPVTGLGLKYIVVGDFNGDSIPDLAVLDVEISSVTILLGKGDGTFTAASYSPLIGGDLCSFAAGDFNGDGITNLAVSSVFVYGKGHLAPSVTILQAETQNATATAIGIKVPGATGYHQVVASYSGDSNNSASTSMAVTLIATPGATDTTSLTVSPNPAATGVLVTMTATVTGNSSPTPTGTVAFLDGTTPVGTASLNSSGVATRTSNVFTAGQHSITASYGGDTIYTASTSPAVVLTVSISSKITPTITWSTPAAITYGTALSATQLNATANVAGSFSYLPPLGTVLTAGSQTLTANFTPTDTTDYNTASSSVTLTVNKATPTITWATPAAITYGTALGATQLDATASVPGTYLYNPAAGVIPPVGSDTLSVTFTPTDTTDYTTANTSVTLVVTIPPNPAPVIGSILPGSVNAGSAAFTLTVNGLGFEANSTVIFGTASLATTYVSATQLTAQVPAADITTQGAYAISVQTPAPGGGPSSALTFEVDSASGSATAPTFSSTTATVTAGSPASYSVTLPSNVVSATVSCLNLPIGAGCSYPSANTVTITTSSATPAGTYQITIVFAETVSGAATSWILLPILLLPLVSLRKKLAARGAWVTACLGLVLLAVTTVVCASCGGGGSSSQPPPQTHQVTSSGTVRLTVH